MSLSIDLIDQFVEATKDEPKETSDGITYGTVIIDGDSTFVQLDGSSIYTPVATTTNVNHGDRVSVLIKNHTATITGNFDSPAATTGDITQLQGVIGQKISTDELNAQSAFIKFLLSDEAILEKIIAAEGEIDKLDVDKLTVDHLESIYGDIEHLKADFAELGVVEIDKAVIKDMNAVAGQFRNLKADHGEFKTLAVSKGEFDDLFANNLEAKVIKGVALDSKFADIEFANIGEAALESFFAKAGMLENVIIGDATVSGALVAVTFKGDVIEAGTLKADRLIILNDKDGLYYQLNINTLGEAIVEELPQDEQTQLQNGLHGGVILAESVTAEKVAVKDLSAFKALIAGFSITDNEYEVTENGNIVLDDDGNPIMSKVGVIYSGVKNSIDNTTRGIYLDNDGQVAFGDTGNFVKFYKNNETGKYELAIAANKIVLGDKSVEDEIDDNKTLIESIKKSLETLVVDSDGGTLFGQTPEGFTFDFAKLNGDIDTLTNNMTESLEYKGRIAFSENNNKPNITISPADRGMKLKLATDSIQFVKDDTPVGTISADDEGRMGMQVDNETVTGELRQSNSNVAGEFIWNVRSNGNYGLWWKG